MANRAYLYSLTNRPTAYTDRPEAISGLSEWPYDIPFSYRLLMSGDPQLCASLIAPGLEDDEPDHPTQLMAISSVFELGYQRWVKWAHIVRHLVHMPVVAQPERKGLWSRLFRPAPAATASAAPAQGLLRGLDETLDFLDQHRHPYLLLETVELDLMSTSDEQALRAEVEAELARCRQAGQALDALPDDVDAAANRLREATTQKLAAPLDAFYGLRLDDDYDNLRDRKTERPLGLEWSDVLYFHLANQAEFKPEP